MRESRFSDEQMVAILREAERAHQPLDRTAGNLQILATELPPDLARAVYTEILLVRAANLRYQRLIQLQPRHKRAGSASRALCS